MPQKFYLFDVMSTLVYDPFYKDLPVAFDTDLRTLLAGRDRMAWVDFECGHLSEAEFFQRFWGNDTDGLRMKHCFMNNYAWLEGIPELLQAIRAKGHYIATASNYPEWYDLIDAKLGLSLLVDQHFVSYQLRCRKPKSKFYLKILKALEVSPSECVFVDDRKDNVQAAEALGMEGHHVQPGMPLGAVLRF